MTNSLVNHKSNFLVMIISLMILLYQRKTILLFPHHGITPWDSGIWRKAKFNTSSLATIKKSFLAAFHQMTELFFLLEPKRILSFGMLEEIVSGLSRQTIIPIGWAESGIHLIQDLRCLLLLDGMEDWKFGLRISLLNILFALMTVLLMLLVFPQLAVILPLVEKINLWRSGTSKT